MSSKGDQEQEENQPFIYKAEPLNIQMVSITNFDTTVINKILDQQC